MSLTFTDIFCGAGGSSIGLTAAGFELKLAANHWKRAIETHATNFTDAEHLCADVNNYDMRRLPKTHILWASPICTEGSPAGGNANTNSRGQLDLLEQGPIEQAGFERTRATFHDVIRATEVHRYTAVLVENVVDVVSKWELFDWWVEGMERLGYNVQFVSVSSAHVGGPDNPHAPQWRDRLYLVFTRTGVRLPDVRPRPWAWCFACEQDVQAVQTWKRPTGPRQVGKYGKQYLYRCPSSACRHGVVEPYVLPAAAAIDWSNVGQRIGDRAKPLAPATMRRIRAGIELFAQPAIVAAHGNTYERPGSGYARAWPTLDGPLQARTGTPGDGLAVPPFMLERRYYNGPDAGRLRGVDSPMATVTVGGRTVHTLVTPPSAEPFVVVNRTNNLPRGADEPLAPFTTGGSHALVNPLMVSVNHGGDDARAYPAVSRPLPARTAKIGDGIVAPFIAELRGGGSSARSVEDPLATLTASGRHHGLTIPPGAFYTKHYTPHGSWGQMSKDVAAEPLGAITATDHHSLVIPFRRGAKPYRAHEGPLSTLATREAHGVMAPAIDPEDCYFRMLQPREHLRGQRFPDSYVVTGNQGEQTMQAGNAVSSNVAQWLATQVAAVL